MAIILNRRSFFRQGSALLAVVQADSLLRTARAAGSVPVGLALYSVEDELAKDLHGTLRAVAKMGYQAVDFWAPYLDWTTEQAKDVRKLLNDLGLRCNTTHNNGPSFTADGLPKAIELNHIIGSKYLVVSGNNMGDVGAGASAGKVPGGLDDWKRVADQLTSISEKIKPAGLGMGYHNHPYEFTPIDGGKRPMDVIAANTPKEVILQLDVGTCVAAKADPVAWIKANPGRLRSIHCKDWAPGPDKQYRVLFGEGVSPWPEIFAAAESVGGVEEYLIEQMTSGLPSFEAAQRCMTNWKKLRG